MDTRSGIAALFEVRHDKWRARILFDGTMVPVEFFGVSDLPNELVFNIIDQHPFINMVSKQEFLCELDHIKLFHCRSDAPSFYFPEDTEENRLTNKQILGILADSEALLDSIDTEKLEEEYNALLSRGALEDSTRTPD